MTLENNQSESFLYCPSAFSWHQNTCYLISFRSMCKQKSSYYRLQLLYKGKSNVFYTISCLIILFFRVLTLHDTFLHRPNCNILMQDFHVCRLAHSSMATAAQENYPTLIIYGVCFMVCLHVAALVSCISDKINGTVYLNVRWIYDAVNILKIDFLMVT